MLIVLEMGNCNLIRTTVMVCVGRNNQLQRNGVKSQQSKQELAEKRPRERELQAQWEPAVSCSAYLKKKKRKKRQTSYWGRSVKVKSTSCELILLFYSP